eukprot:m.179538 g.179538  ORF g.179538 m.179538 type:complete len:413 (-) comp21446_c1_seq5:36-1274(-)
MQQGQPQLQYQQGESLQAAEERDQLPAGWSLYRRFRTFEHLHSLLKAHYGTSMHRIHLPHKRRLFDNMSVDFVEYRQRELDVYLNAVMAAGLGAAVELRDFLDPDSATYAAFDTSHNYVSRIASFSIGQVTRLAKSVGNIAIQPFVSRRDRTEMFSMSNVLFVPRRRPESHVSYPFERLLAKHQQELLAQPEEPGVPLAGTRHYSWQTAGFASLVLNAACEFFDVKWIRQRYKRVFTILSALLRSFIERTMREHVRRLTAARRIKHYLKTLRTAFWPGGVWDATVPPERSEQEKRETRAQALVLLMDLLPAMVNWTASGQQISASAVRNVLASLEHTPLTRHLVLHLFDAVVALLVPELCVDAALFVAASDRWRRTAAAFKNPHVAQAVFEVAQNGGSLLGAEARNCWQALD